MGRTTRARAHAHADISPFPIPCARACDCMTSLPLPPAPLAPFPLPTRPCRPPPRARAMHARRTVHRQGDRLELVVRPRLLVWRRLHEDDRVLRHGARAGRGGRRGRGEGGGARLAARGDAVALATRRREKYCGGETQLLYQ